MKKWVSGEFKTPKELIIALLGDEEVWGRGDDRIMTLTNDGLVCNGGCDYWELHADEVTLADFGYMREVPWYEDIPEYGVLCWHVGPNGFAVVIIDSVVDGVATTSGSVECRVENLIPFTNKELKSFMVVEE